MGTSGEQPEGLFIQQELPVILITREAQETLSWGSGGLRTNCYVHLSVTFPGVSVASIIFSKGSVPQRDHWEMH